MTVAAAWAEEELGLLRARGLLRALEPLESPQGPVVRVGGRALVNFSSNDYLGLAAAPELAGALSRALATHGTGSGASRLVSGDLAAHHALEEKLARFEGTEAALLFNSGYAANVGVLGALLGAGDVVFSDALNHASLIDGCRLSRAKVVTYPHLDVAALSRALAEHSGRRRLVCTDAVFSMDGDRAPLPELAEVCRRQGAGLLVDEAHATGVLGPRGAGLCEALGVVPDVKMGTLGKALGVFGAYVACRSPVRALLYNRARSLVFSTALPPALCEAASVALDLVSSQPERRAHLAALAERFAGGLRRLGFPAVAQSAVFPVVLGAPEAAVAASAFLREEGLLVKAIRPPTVPEGTSRLRFALSAAHSEAQVEHALWALSRWEK